MMAAIHSYLASQAASPGDDTTAEHAAPWRWRAASTLTVQDVAARRGGPRPAWHTIERLRRMGADGQGMSGL